MTRRTLKVGLGASVVVPGDERSVLTVALDFGLLETKLRSAPSGWFDPDRRLE